MRKRKYLYLLPMVLVAVIALFMTTEAGATCVSPECFVVDGWQVEIVKGQSGEFPVVEDCSGEPCDKYEYAITPAPSGNRVNQIYLLVPVCTENPINVLESSSSSFAYFEAGAGDPTTGIGVGDLEQRVMSWSERINPGTVTRNFWVKTTRTTPGESSMSLKLGNTLKSGLIASPSCYEPLAVTETSRTITTQEVGSMTCQTDQDGNLIGCVDENNQPLNEYSNEDITCTLTSGENSQTINLNFASETCTISGHGSPGATWYYYRGRWICLGTSCP
ncbi:MAG: hypothetical protein L0958_04680 [Candidatus Mariimomonas ferrooxydans]